MDVAQVNKLQRGGELMCLLMSKGLFSHVFGKTICDKLVSVDLVGKYPQCLGYPGQWYLCGGRERGVTRQVHSLKMKSPKDL